MKRRSKTKFTQIHVSIPVRLLEDLDDSLSYSSSRSKLIAALITKYLESDTESPSHLTTRQLMAYLLARDDCNSVLKASLLEVLSVKS